MLGKAWWHTTEKLPDGSFKYDVVLLDAPATGHGLDMLRVPQVILEVVPPGLLRRDAERAMAEIWASREEAMIDLKRLTDYRDRNLHRTATTVLHTERVGLNRHFLNGIRIRRQVRRSLQDVTCNI